MTSPPRATSHVVVLVGRGAYGDPWHDHAGTSDAIAQVLRADGHDVSVRSAFPDALDDVMPDLLVVNAGAGPRTDEDHTRLHDRRDALVRAGTAVLAVHQAANTFGDDPRWAATLGGRWVEGTSWHPEIGQATFAADGAHPVSAGLGTVAAHDERYCDLVVDDAVRVFLRTHVDGREHPIAWTHGERVVYDATGHDPRAYAAPDRRELLRREVAWLLRD
ncbi:ThuA domain-containing protein [Cellulomonas sp. JH27-2]|uniref:ThuA domain-containing protein n=1 Tax=Cellulomonas sp. JH27-2 TaxID=2774139 RepID=UPI001783E4B9|nr:ThuA domain-containing protein [Cellulomonas sp. JH27-2]MBD8057506.1 ThuA domain-containing protein [Cellulomonas sp. JH27-2]